MSYIVIVREGDPNRERAVKLVIHETKRTSIRWVNPRVMVGWATGTHPSRAFCIVSLAEGLADAGHTVEFLYARSGRVNQKGVHVVRTHYIAPEYYILGLALGVDRWETIVQQLKDIVPWRRYDILCQSGRWYMVLGGLPFYEELALQLG